MREKDIGTLSTGPERHPEAAQRGEHQDEDDRVLHRGQELRDAPGRDGQGIEQDGVDVAGKRSGSFE